MNALINIADGFWGRTNWQQYVHLSYSNDCRDTHTHTHTLSLPHTCTSLSVSLALPCRPFKLPMSFSVGCQNTIWLLATLPGSSRISIQSRQAGGRGKGVGDCQLDKGVLRSPIDKRPVLPAHQSLSQRTKQANSGQPTTNGRWCQLPLLPLPLTTSCHPPNVINALPLHTDSARDTLS